MGQDQAAGDRSTSNVGAALLRVFDEDDDARLLLSVDRSIVLVNQACERVFGRSRAELVGKSARVLVPTRLFDYYDEIYRRLMSADSNGVISVNMWGVRADGAEFPVRVVCRLLSRGDTPPLLSVVILDRSPRGRDERLRNFLETVHNGNVLVDQTGRIVMVNARAEEMFGYAGEELVGQPIELLVPPEYRDAHVAHRTAFAGGAGRHAMNHGEPVVARRRDGTGFPARVLLSSIGRGPDLLIAASVLDVSEIEDLRSESDRLKEQFLATVSHELRTPLTSIIGSAEMLGDEVEAIEDAELRGRLERFTHIILRGARRQQALVEDLLTLTSVDRGDAHGASNLADLMVAVENVVHDFGPSARSKGIALTADSTGLPILVAADERWLARAVECLVSNAVKFTPAGGSVQLTAGSSDGSAWLEVSDTGPGIPEDERERVFDRLSRGAAAVAGEVPGAGLGLAIARSVVEANGGTLVVVPPRPDEQGARLRMTLPGLGSFAEVRLP